MEFFWTQIWILIPLAAIAVGAFKEWLKFKAKQDRLGTSAAELERTVEGLRDELKGSEETRKRLVQRVQNLETIVTTEMWDIVHGSGDRIEPPSSGTARAPSLEIPDAEEEVADRVSKIADRLRNM